MKRSVTQACGLAINKRLTVEADGIIANVTVPRALATIRNSVRNRKAFQSFLRSHFRQGNLGSDHIDEYGNPIPIWEGIDELTYELYGTSIGYDALDACDMIITQEQAISARIPQGMGKLAFEKRIAPRSDVGLRHADYDVNTLDENGRDTLASSHVSYWQAELAARELLETEKSDISVTTKEGGKIVVVG